MQTESFETQGALLSYLGKNINDRSLIKRMVERGEVFKQDGLYHLVIKDGEVVKREKKSESNEVKIDDRELRESKRMNEKLMAAYKKLSKEKEAYMGMYDHLVFFYGKFREWKKFVDGKVFGQAEHNKKVNETQDTMETVRPEVYERYKFTYGEVEEAECEAVEKIISKRAEELAELPF